MALPTRRAFLESSLFASAAALAASAPRFAWSEESASKSPNDKLSVAVVGVRSRGKSHTEAYSKRPDTEITYICDADEQIGQAECDDLAKRQQRRPKYVRDMRELFDDKSVDIVTTATPNHWHALTSIWAMQAGKDVYVEKPVSHNVSEGRRIVETARKHKRICQTGTQSRSNPGMRQMMEYLLGGGIGDVKVARGLCYKRRPSIGPKGTYQPPQSVNFDLWCGPAPVKPLTRPKLHYDWHWTWDYGNGDLGNQGIHQMDLARWGLGLDRLSDQVFSFGGRFGYDDAGETANTQVVVHDYGDKTLVFEVRGLETEDLDGAGVGVIFYGTEGKLVSPSYSGGTHFDKAGKVVKSFNQGDDKYHFDNFIKAVRSRKHEDLNADIEEGHLSSALCHLGNISYLLGDRVPVGEARERLKSVHSGDDLAAVYKRFEQHLAANGVPPEFTAVQFGRPLAFDAAEESFRERDLNSWLTREYRAPFVVPAAGQV